MRTWALAGSLVLAVAAIAQTTQIRPAEPWPEDLVRLDVMVVDAAGTPVDGLDQASFEIESEGRVLPVARFTAGGPLSAAIIVDVTASLHAHPFGVAGIPSTASSGVSTNSPSLATQHARGGIPPAVAGFPLNGTRGDDRIRVGAITRKPSLGAAVAGDSRELAQAWKALFERPPVEWLGPSPIFDAVADAVTWASRESGRRAVILMTDGLATGNRLGHEDVAAMAALNGTSINVIAEAAVPAQLRDPTGPLRTLADASGGMYTFNQIGTQRQRSDMFQRILDNLHRAYSLGITPVVDGKLHMLTVRVKKDGVTVTAVKGYVRRGN